MPGDVFRNKGGTIQHVIDRFVSIGVRGGEMPGYFIRSESPDGTVKHGSTAIVILRFRKRTWTVVKTSRAKAAGWDKVQRCPHSEVDAIMRRKHGIRPSSTAAAK
jgi:hypothetical protein